MAGACAVERTAADRCPGSVVLHRAQDGLLARVRIPGGRVSSDQLLALARAAALGNGLVELTSRANLQLRGLRPGGRAQLAEVVRNAGLMPSPAHDRVRNVIASPLAGRHPRSRSCTDDVVGGLDRALCARPELADLPGRLLMVVDDGSGIALDRRADVTLIAAGAGGYSLAIAGRLAAATLSSSDAVSCAVAVVAAFLAECRGRGSGAWRISELGGGAEAIARRIGVELTPRLVEVSEARVGPGVIEQRDGRLALTGLARLGRLRGEQIAELAGLAGELRIGTGRTVTILDVEPAAADDLQAGLEAAGLIAEPSSGWVGLTACAGHGRCDQARADLSGALDARARSRDPVAPAEHWTACERRCGERADQPIAVAASERGISVRTGEAELVAESLDGALTALDDRQR